MTCPSERVEARFYIICQNGVTKYRLNASWKIKNLIFSRQIYVSFQLLKKTTKSREERSTCHTVAVLLHRSTISRPKIIQIFPKTSRSKACSIDISSPFLVFAIFLNSGLYLTINIVVFDHSIFTNHLSPESS